MPLPFRASRALSAVATCMALLFIPAEGGAASPSAATKANLANAPALITHYYQTILGRSPDAGGLAFWQSEAARVTDLGASINEVWYAMAMAFFFSPEYAALNRTSTGFVTDLYRAFFNRQPDAGGLAYWGGQLAGGMPREVALVSFLFSTEFAIFTQGLFGAPLSAPETDAVGDFYRGLLARLGDSTGFNYWLGRFRAAQCNSAAALYAEVEAISSAFGLSPEYLGKGRTNAQYVGDLYNAFLRRGGDLSGVLFWINELASGARTREELRRAFLASPEFSGRVQAMVASGCRPMVLQSSRHAVVPSASSTLSPAIGGSVTIPAGTYASSVELTVARATLTAVARSDFLDTTLLFDSGPPASEVFVLDSGSVPPAAAFTVSLPVPVAFLSGLPAGHKPHLFAQAHTPYIDGFAPLDSTFDAVAGTLSASVPPWACTRSRNGLQTWECLLAIGSLPSSFSAAAEEKDFTTAGCTLNFYSPIKGKTPPALALVASSPYGTRFDPDAGGYRFHQGTDYSVKDGTPLVPAADGYVWRMGCSKTYGEFLIIRHANGSSTLYGHLSMGSLQLKDSNGANVDYPACKTQKPTETVWKAFVPSAVPVIGGYTPIGLSDSTGRTRGEHLHFEYSAGKIIVGKAGMGGRLDGAACVTQDPPPASCNTSYCYDKCFSAYLACYNACPASPPITALQCMRGCDNTFWSCPSTTRMPSCTCVP